MPTFQTKLSAHSSLSTLPQQLTCSSAHITSSKKYRKKGRKKHCRSPKKNKSQRFASKVDAQNAQLDGGSIDPCQVPGARHKARRLAHGQLGREDASGKSTVHLLGGGGESSEASSGESEREKVEADEATSRAAGQERHQDLELVKDSHQLQAHSSRKDDEIAAGAVKASLLVGAAGTDAHQANSCINVGASTAQRAVAQTSSINAPVSNQLSQDVGGTNSGGNGSVLSTDCMLHLKPCGAEHAHGGVATGSQSRSAALKAPDLGTSESTSNVADTHGQLGWEGSELFNKTDATLQHADRYCDAQVLLNQAKKLAKTGAQSPASQISIAGIQPSVEEQEPWHATKQVVQASTSMPKSDTLKFVHSSNDEELVLSAECLSSGNAGQLSKGCGNLCLQGHSAEEAQDLTSTACSRSLKNQSSWLLHDTESDATSSIVPVTCKVQQSTSCVEPGQQGVSHKSSMGDRVDQTHPQCHQQQLPPKESDCVAQADTAEATQLLQSDESAKSADAEQSMIRQRKSVVDPLWEDIGRGDVGHVETTAGPHLQTPGSSEHCKRTQKVDQHQATVPKTQRLDVSEKGQSGTERSVSAGSRESSQGSQHFTSQPRTTCTLRGKTKVDGEIQQAPSTSIVREPSSTLQTADSDSAFESDASDSLPGWRKPDKLKALPSSQMAVASQQLLTCASDVSRAMEVENCRSQERATRVMRSRQQRSFTSGTTRLLHSKRNAGSNQLTLAPSLQLTSNAARGNISSRTEPGEVKVASLPDERKHTQETSAIVGQKGDINDSSSNIEDKVIDQDVMYSTRLPLKPKSIQPLMLGCEDAGTLQLTASLEPLHLSNQSRRLSLLSSFDEATPPPSSLPSRSILPSTSYSEVDHATASGQVSEPYLPYMQAFRPSTPQLTSSLSLGHATTSARPIDDRDGGPPSGAAPLSRPATPTTCQAIAIPSLTSEETTWHFQISSPPNRPPTPGSTWGGAARLEGCAGSPPAEVAPKVPRPPMRRSPGGGRHGTAPRRKVVAKHDMQQAQLQLSLLDKFLQRELRQSEEGERAKGWKGKLLGESSDDIWTAQSSSARVKESAAGDKGDKGKAVAGPESTPPNLVYQVYEQGVMESVHSPAGWGLDLALQGTQKQLAPSRPQSAVHNTSRAQRISGGHAIDIPTDILAQGGLGTLFSSRNLGSAGDALTPQSQQEGCMSSVGANTKDGGSGSECAQRALQHSASAPWQAARSAEHMPMVSRSWSHQLRATPSQSARPKTASAWCGLVVEGRVAQGEEAISKAVQVEERGQDRLRALLEGCLHVLQSGVRDGWLDAWNGAKALAESLSALFPPPTPHHSQLQPTCHQLLLTWHSAAATDGPLLRLQAMLPSTHVDAAHLQRVLHAKLRSVQPRPATASRRSRPATATRTPATSCAKSSPGLAASGGAGGDGFVPKHPEQMALVIKGASGISPPAGQLCAQGGGGGRQDAVQGQPGQKGADGTSAQGVAVAGGRLVAQSGERAAMLASSQSNAGVDMGEGLGSQSRGEAQQAQARRSSDAAELVGSRLAHKLAIEEAERDHLAPEHMQQLTMLDHSAEVGQRAIVAMHGGDATTGHQVQAKVPMYIQHMQEAARTAPVPLDAVGMHMLSTGQKWAENGTNEVATKRVFARNHEKGQAQGRINAKSRSVRGEASRLLSSIKSMHGMIGNGSGRLDERQQPRASIRMKLQGGSF